MLRFPQEYIPKDLMKLMQVFENPLLLEYLLELLDRNCYLARTVRRVYALFGRPMMSAKEIPIDRFLAPDNYETAIEA